MNRVGKQQGFTIIELLLAMAFISVLLLAIAMTVLQIGTIYNRGLTTKAVNQVSRSMTNELETSIAAARSFSVDPDAQRYLNEEWGGRLCLGNYSYIWNYGKARSTQHPDLNEFTNESTNEISFVKVSDPSATYCADPSLDINPNGAVELLTSGDRDLALHAFSITTSTTAADATTGQQLYTVTFTIGTNDPTALNADQSACLPPNVLGSDLAYCSVQQFRLVLRTGNGVN